MEIKKRNRQLAVGKIVRSGGRKDIYTLGGRKVNSYAGDVKKTNKKGETVIVRKNGNRVILGSYGRVTRVKASGDRLITLAPGERNMIPAGSTPVRGSRVRRPSTGGSGR